MGWQPIFFNLFDLKYQLSINIIANERERERERENLKTILNKSNLK